MPRTTLFLLHGLGLSGRSWDGVVAALGDELDPVVIDLPGHGSAADSEAVTAEETAVFVAARIVAAEPDRWLIAGHGIGGRIAAIVTSWAERGEHGLTPADGLALVAAVPPSPAPQDDRLRAAWAEGAISAADAAAFVDRDIALALPEPARTAAIEDVERASRVAVLEWLERGVLEDRSDEVGVLRTPAVVLVGSQDAGAARELPAVPDAPVHEVDGAARLLPLEAPQEVAAHLAALAARVRDRPALPAAFARLIASDRVSARTRRVMLARLTEPDPASRALSAAQHELLTLVLARIVPQRGTDVDLASRIDAGLGAGLGDGWRFAELPPDLEAYRRGLDTIAALEPGFASLDAAAQDEVLDRIADGALGSDEKGLLTADRMRLWFGDVQADAVRTWLSHPAAQAWIRYDGFADGGDGPRKQGFTTTHAGEWEAWQRDWRTGEELQA
ncbi:hypothetical protein GCM10025783_10900 [Amnibacterium soli]|uniref:AB hydrolase-1 domain-containing protein n=1 Tax=Amnibacterium soli TaxID=1282736 RepID=A0ABP8YYQ7_9MICO